MATILCTILFCLFLWETYQLGLVSHVEKSKAWWGRDFFSFPFFNFYLGIWDLRRAIFYIDIFHLYSISWSNFEVTTTNDYKITWTITKLGWITIVTKFLLQLKLYPPKTIHFQDFRNTWWKIHSLYIFVLGLPKRQTYSHQKCQHI